MEAPDNFDPSYMAADIIQVELEIGPSTLIGYGTVLKNFLELKVGVALFSSSSLS